MLPATATALPRYARSQTREQEILALLTERRDKRLTAAEIAAALRTDVENLRATLSRLHRRQAIGMSHEIRTYRVGNSQCKHRAALWFAP